MSRHKLEISQIRKLFKIILIDDESEMKLLILSRYHEDWRQDRKLKGKLDNVRGAISRWPVCPKRDSSLISLLLIRLHCLIIDI